MTLESVLQAAKQDACCQPAMDAVIALWQAGWRPGGKCLLPYREWHWPKKCPVPHIVYLGYEDDADKATIALASKRYGDWDDVVLQYRIIGNDVPNIIAKFSRHQYAKPTTNTHPAYRRYRQKHQPKPQHQPR